MHDTTPKVVSSKNRYDSNLSTAPDTQNSRAPSEAIPEYLEEVYNWAYIDEKNVQRLDRDWVFNGLLFGNGWRLKKAYLSRIQPGMRVWQVAHVYGKLVQDVAQKVGPNGQFDITDIAPIQIRQILSKVGDQPQVSIYQSDAATWTGKNYDVSCSFFLLHEVPDEKKTEIIHQVLNSIAANGQAIFVDYHRPAPWQRTR